MKLLKHIITVVPFFCFAQKDVDRDAIDSVFFKIIPSILTIDSIEFVENLNSKQVEYYIGKPTDNDGQLLIVHSTFKGLPIYFRLLKSQDTLMIRQDDLLTIDILNKMLVNNKFTDFNTGQFKKTIQNGVLGVKKVKFTNYTEGIYYDKWFGNKNVPFRLSFKVIQKFGECSLVFSSNKYVGFNSKLDQENIELCVVFESTSFRENYLPEMKRFIIFDLLTEQIRSVEVLSPYQVILIESDN